jgi:hypothetical protein
MKIIEKGNGKALFSENYNYIFRKSDGFFMRWGKTTQEDPQFSPYGPELIDMELSINGCPNNCSFCYKSNNSSEPINMSFDTFVKIFKKLPKTVTQIAFGITGIQTNPNFLKILEYCKENGVIPNFTLSGIDLTDSIALQCSKLIGAVAVSAYQQDKNICYNTVEKFIGMGISQTNIHLLVAEENLDFVYEVVKDSQTDKRLKNLNAIVLLGVKSKGRAKESYSSLSSNKFQKLVKYCFDNEIDIGFDSCSAPKFESSIKNMDMSESRKQELNMLSESCESFGLFSAYINVFGDYFPCSFAENEKGWENGLSVLHCDDFLKDIWFSNKVKKWRKKSLDTCYNNGCRRCLIFEEINPEKF